MNKGRNKRMWNVHLPTYLTKRVFYVNQNISVLLWLFVCGWKKERERVDVFETQCDLCLHFKSHKRPCLCKSQIHKRCELLKQSQRYWAIWIPKAVPHLWPWNAALKASYIVMHGLSLYRYLCIVLIIALTTLSVEIHRYMSGPYYKAIAASVK